MTDQPTRSGHPADLVIIDDPIRETLTADQRQDITDWYDRTVLPRTTAADPMSGGDPMSAGRPDAPGWGHPDADPVFSDEIAARRRRARLPGLRALREADARIGARADVATTEGRQAVLNRLDVEAWRVPADGLLEYDLAFDEWRVEVYADPLGARLDGPRRIVRRRAGRFPYGYARGGVIGKSWAYRQGDPHLGPAGDLRMADLAGVHRVLTAGAEAGRRLVEALEPIVREHRGHR